TTINDYTFFDCGALTNVTIPSGVTSIGPVAFLACFSLTTVIIPDSVTDITEEAFEECTNLTTITIPKGVTAIGLREFFDCTKLTSVYFKGNAPTVGDLAFAAGVPSQDPATVYYLPGTTGWGSTLGGLPTRLWNPQVQPGSFGIRTNQFGFNITGSSNLVVVIEASTNLLNPSWYPLQTNTLNGNSLHFADPQWTNYPSRFYRLSMP
ncbi:MAG TPA: leucine-rich repeat domain-containing protein, partial [Dongiaceae bacterium]|nr:leucine-rich repeat domain-containing protein [Dongiaceae bacterium]